MMRTSLLSPRGLGFRVQGDLPPKPLRKISESDQAPGPFSFPPRHKKACARESEP